MRAKERLQRAGSAHRLDFVQREATGALERWWILADVVQVLRKEQGKGMRSRKSQAEPGLEENSKLGSAHCKTRSHHRILITSQRIKKKKK